MNIADKIQSLRKSKGMSQEELAEKIGVSRQTISKWESEQSTPDVDKVIILSDFFDVTTDYLLKGIEQKEHNNPKKQIDSKILSSIGTMFNFVGLMAAITIWIEKQVFTAVAVGMILVAFGCMVHIVGRFIGDKKQISSNWFWVVNIWFIVLMPLSCIFNCIQGVIGGFWWTFSPIPQIGNSLILYGVFWLLYFMICVSIDYILFSKIKSEVEKAN